MPSSKPLRPHALIASLIALASSASLAACSFGDDRHNGEPVSPDGPAKPDAMPIDAPPGFDAPTEAKVFEMNLDPPLAIPDNNMTGVTVMIPVSGVTYVTKLEVTVDATHTWQGDLRIQLLRGSNLISTLKQDKKGDSTSYPKTVYPVAAAQLGTPYNGTYAIRFVDVENLISGTVNSIQLTFKVD